jgi:hypothetical protein
VVNHCDRDEGLRQTVRIALATSAPSAQRRNNQNAFVLQQSALIIFGTPTLCKVGDLPGALLALLPTSCGPPYTNCLSLTELDMQACELSLIVLPFPLAVASWRVMLGIRDRIAHRVHLFSSLEICLKCTRMPPFSPFFF